MATGTNPIRGDIGLLIRVDMKEDMSTATGLNFEVEKPDGEITRWTPTASGDFLEYTTIAGDLNVVGTYRISPILTTGTFSGRAKLVTFEVVDKFAV